VPRRQLKCRVLVEGIAASPGIAIGKAFVLSGEAVRVRERSVAPAEVEEEIESFLNAVKKAKEEIGELQQRVAQEIGHENAKIFDVHRMLLEDEELHREVIELIRAERQGADWAFYNVILEKQTALQNSDSEYLRSRVADLRDVKRRVIRHIGGERIDYLASLEGSAIIVAHDLTPSETVQLDRHKVLGFATDLGGGTSHASIMARSMGIPAVVGLRRITKVTKTGDRLVLDGNNGLVLVDPSSETLEFYYQLQAKYYDFEARLSEIRDLPSRTLDGKDVELTANIDFPDEVEAVLSHGARGVGLYRTDHLYLTSPEPPAEELQYREFRKVVERMNPLPVVLRSMDVGGDKLPSSFQIPPEDNPFLGWRAIRIALERPDLFKPEIRAILRASAHGNVKLLLPMISSLDEVRQAKEFIAECKTELRREGIPFDDEMEIGVMIEVPAAAVIADQIAGEVDFLSIGTNDLVQYLLAVDRGNERIAYLYQHLHPAVLRVIEQVVHSGHQRGVWVSMCGEMAGDPQALLLLLGLGIDELSMSPVRLPEIKNMIRSTTYEYAVEVVKTAMAMNTADEVERYVGEIMREKFKDLFFKE
jgi:phosphotransferase system enzyme I (PtsI)